MKKLIALLTFLLLLTIANQLLAQQVSPEEKAQLAAHHMQKRLGLKDKQIQYIYSLNLTKIQKARIAKSEKADNYKKLSRHFEAICEEYNHRLRGVLTPEQFQRWEVLRAESIQRRKVLENNLVLEQHNTYAGEELTDPEAVLDHLVTQ